MKKHLRLILLTALIALAFVLPGGVSEIAASDVSDDGLVRVYLKSLGDISSMTVTVAGEYVIENNSAFRFERGAGVIFGAENGRVFMSVAGLTLDMGQSVELTRCLSDGEENGLYIYQSERNALYEGDLRISCEGGALKCVLTMSVEDYLRGVVAYEMSDSFPLEALKAQAVAARTYVMGKKAARAGESYDVTDTTSDQVFKGYIADYVNVSRAVEETAGVVGMYKGKYAGCYYTASNGGQIATPTQIWGGTGDYGYIEMKADPYDLENPSSIVNSIAVPSGYDAASAVYAMLDSRLDRAGHVDVRIDSIADMTPVSPDTEGSLMCAELNVTLDISARDYGLIEVDFAGTRAEGWAKGLIGIGEKFFAFGLKPFAPAGQQEVVLSVYEDVKEALGLGMNGSDCEILSVAKTETGFSLEMRRYGHGVGMSQRGAQTMAGQYGADYEEILNFYYPGMRLERVSWNTPALPDMTALPEAVARERVVLGAIQSELPEPLAGEYIAVVTLDSDGSRLNVRARPSTDSDVICRLAPGYRLVVSGDAGDGWVSVYTADFSGYVKAEYLAEE